MSLFSFQILRALHLFYIRMSNLLFWPQWSPLKNECILTIDQNHLVGFILLFKWLLKAYTSSYTDYVYKWFQHHNYIYNYSFLSHLNKFAKRYAKKRLSNQLGCLPTIVYFKVPLDESQTTSQGLSSLTDLFLTLSGFRLFRVIYACIQDIKWCLATLVLSFKLVAANAFRVGNLALLEWCRGMSELLYFKYAIFIYFVSNALKGLIMPR
jgi:hypothetical protein